MTVPKFTTSLPAEEVAALQALGKQSRLSCDALLRVGAKLLLREIAAGRFDLTPYVRPANSFRFRVLDWDAVTAAMQVSPPPTPRVTSTAWGQSAKN